MTVTLDGGPRVEEVTDGQPSICQRLYEAPMDNPWYPNYQRAQLNGQRERAPLCAGCNGLSWFALFSEALWLIQEHTVKTTRWKKKN